MIDKIKKRQQSIKTTINRYGVKTKMVSVVMPLDLYKRLEDESKETMVPINKLFIDTIIKRYYPTETFPTYIKKLRANVKM